MEIAFYYVISLAVGLLVSLGLGHVVMAALARRIKETTDQGGVSPAFVGFTERLVFTIAWTVAGPATGLGMFSWLALKLAANWKTDSRVFGGLLKGFVSLSLAALGGMVALRLFAALIAWTLPPL